jgi:hypothetical protein
MTKLTLAVPSTGEKNTVAEPKVDTALKAIETWANGEVGTGNIPAEVLTEAMLVKALQEKLTTKLGLKLQIKNESLEGVSEVFYEMEKESSTLTLPAPTLNRMIGIGTNSIINAVKVTASSGKIFTPQHSAGATTVEVTKLSPIIVLADGSNWLRIAGEEKSEQTYKEKTLTKAEAEAGFVLSATRTVFLSTGSEVTSIGGAPVKGGGTGWRIPPGQTIILAGTFASNLIAYLIE